MNFNVKNINSIYKSEIELQEQYNVEELEELKRKSFPISKETYRVMKEFAADPKNLKISIIKDDYYGTQMFIESVEFMNFCEASAKGNIKEGADSIIEAYIEKFPDICLESINVVFPDDAFNKDNIGSTNYGVDTDKDWPVKLIRGCCHYGIKPRIGVNDK